MKTAEDFRNDLGETEESFRACVRQTLTTLECKEEKPVKKKISKGLVLVLAAMLLTATAVAEEQWGILSFLKSQGKPATEDQLLPLNTPEPYPYKQHELVDAVMTEALYEDGALYLAVTLTPLHEKTLVVPGLDAGLKPRAWNQPDPNDLLLNDLTMRSAMRDDTYEDVSVQEYARSHGFDHVVMMSSYYVDVNSTHAHWSQDQLDGLQQVAYQHLEDGSLQMILQIGYRPNLAFGDAGRRETAYVTARVYSYCLANEGEWHGKTIGSASTWADFTLQADRVHLRSLPEDAHDIVGYIGAVEYISIAPYDDDQMAITIQLNLGDEKTEDTWMTGPDWIIMDAEGNRLCKVDETKFYGLRTQPDENGDRRNISHGLFPAEYMPEGGQITLRAENWRNYNIVYDEYTYTLTDGQAADAETSVKELE